MLAQKVYQLMVKGKEKAESSTKALVVWWLIAMTMTIGIAIAVNTLFS